MAHNIEDIKACWRQDGKLIKDQVKWLIETVERQALLIELPTRSALVKKVASECAEIAERVGGFAKLSGSNPVAAAIRERFGVEEGK